MPKSKLFTDYIFRFVQRLFFIRDKRRQPKPNLAIGGTFVPLKRRSKVLPEISYVILGYSDIVRSTAPYRTGFETMQEARGRGGVPRVDATGTGHGPPLFCHGPTAVTETSFAKRQTQLTSFPHRKFLRATISSMAGPTGTNHDRWFHILS